MVHTAIQVSCPRCGQQTEVDLGFRRERMSTQEIECQHCGDSFSESVPGAIVAMRSNPPDCSCEACVRTGRKW